MTLNLTPLNIPVQPNEPTPVVEPPTLLPPVTPTPPGLPPLVDPEPAIHRFSGRIPVTLALILALLNLVLVLGWFTLPAFQNNGYVVALTYWLAFGGVLYVTGAMIGASVVAIILAIIALRDDNTSGRATLAIIIALITGGLAALSFITTYNTFQRIEEDHRQSQLKIQQVIEQAEQK